MEIDVKKVLEDYKHETFCDPCKFTGKQITAKGYCKICEGYMCPACVKAHKRAKETKLHVIVDSHKMAQETKSLRSLEHCDKHKNILESFCEEHDAACCRECISTEHKDCRKMVPLQRASVGIHDNNELKQTTIDLEYLIANFERRVRDEKDSLNRVDEQGKQFGDSVKKFRVEINKLIDKIEMGMYLTRDEVIKDEKKILNERVNLCQKALPNLRQGEEIMKKINNKTEDKLAFIAMKSVRHMVQQYELVHQEVLDTQGKFSLKFLPNRDLLSALDSIGSINVKSTLRPIGSAAENGELQEDRLEQVGEVNVRAPTDTTTCTVTGCAYLPDGRLILADESNQSIKLFDTNLTFIASFKTSVPPWDIAAISDAMIAVRSSFSDTDVKVNKIEIIEIAGKSLKHKREISIDGRPRAIRFSNQHLYVACSEGKKAHILVLDNNDKVVRTLRPKAGVLNQPQYIAVSSSADLVWVSDFYNGIIALDMKGGVRFKLTDSHVTEYGGITIDEYDDVYICAGKPYGIYKVGHDGKELKCLYEWQTDTVDPQTLVYYPPHEHFLITSCNSDKALIFRYNK